VKFRVVDWLEEGRIAYEPTGIDQPHDPQMMMNEKHNATSASVVGAESECAGAGMGEMGGGRRRKKRENWLGRMMMLMGEEW
jgi:hypothetical protein